MKSSKLTLAALAVTLAVGTAAGTGAQRGIHTPGTGLTTTAVTVAQ